MSLLDHWFSKAPAAKAMPAVPAGISPHAPINSRRQQRMKRRELLYGVVRAAMVRAGMQSGSYSFKVLSLESQGRQYIIMIDLAQDGMLDTRHQGELETQITHEAKSQHDIQVKAIYWRLNERLAGTPRKVAGVLPLSNGARFEPIGEDEVAALKQALAAGMATTLPPDFEDTEVIGPAEPKTALGPTQYGDLH